MNLHRKRLAFQLGAYLYKKELYLKITNLQTDWESLRKAEDELLINSLSMLCPFDQHEKQALLEAKTIKDRANVLQTLMEMTIKAEKSFGPLQ